MNLSFKEMVVTIICSLYCAGVCAMAAAKTQVLLLVNTKPPANGSDVEQRQRAVCLACTRLLLTKFPAPTSSSSSPSERLQWSYKFFSTEAPAGGAFHAGISRAEFQEVRSELLEKFYGEMLAHMTTAEEFAAAAAGPATAMGRVLRHSWGRHVYSALAASVQDFLWDVPEIKSPVRPQRRNKKLTTVTRSTASLTTTTSSSNFIFLFSEGPTSSSVATGMEGSSLATAATTLAGQILPKPLLSQLQHKGIHVHWVWLEEPEEGGVVGGVAWKKAFAVALQAVGGMVLPINLVLDLESQTLFLPKLMSGQVKKGCG